MKPSVETEANGKVVQCKTNNVSYMATCKTCESEGKTKVYYGETSCNIHVRSKEHYKDCANNKKVSWMRKHMMESHNNDINKCDFSWKVIGKFKKPMLRQLSEAIHINNTDNNKLLNLKNEYFKNNIENMKMVTDSPDYTCRNCSRKLASREELSIHMIDFHEKFTCQQCKYEAFGKIDINLHMQTKH